MAEVQVQAFGTGPAPLQRVTKDSEHLDLLALEATLDGSGAASAWVPAVQIVSDSGDEVGTFPLAGSLAAGDTATVTWAPFLGRGGGTVQHAGYYWSNNVAAAGVVGPGGNTYYTAVWDFMQNQWGADLLDITNQALPKVRQAGLYSFSFQVRLITGHSLMGAYAGKNVEVFTTFNTVPAPLFGNMDVRFPMDIIRDWIYPTSSSAFVCSMQAGDSFQGGFYTDQATLGALYQGFGDASIVMSRLDVTDAGF